MACCLKVTLLLYPYGEARGRLLTDICTGHKKSFIFCNFIYRFKCKFQRFLSNRRDFNWGKCLNEPMSRISMAKGWIFWRMRGDIWVVTVWRIYRANNTRLSDPSWIKKENNTPAEYVRRFTYHLPFVYENLPSSTYNRYKKHVNKSVANLGWVIFFYRNNPSMLFNLVLQEINIGTYLKFIMVLLNLIVKSFGYEYEIPSAYLIGLNPFDWNF